MKELILFAAIWLVFIPEPLRAQEAVNLEDENARINYSVGYQVGGDFRRQGLELDPEVVAKGIEDALSGNKPLMTPAEMRKALTELHCALRPGGRLILIFPNDRMFKIARLGMAKFREAFYDPGHVKQWTPVTIKKELTNAGFSVIHRQNLPFGVWPYCLHHLVVGEKI